MPISQLEKRVALLVIDLQVATAGHINSRDIEPVIVACERLTTAFRRTRMPVVLARADLNAPPVGRAVYFRPRPATPDAALALVPALAPAPDDIVVGRRAWSPFSGTDLDQRLRTLGVTQVVLAGLATSFGIESSARAAYDLDYHVVVAIDAIADPFPDRHNYSVSSVFPVISELGTCEEIIGLLDLR